jgi:hypothetical protein
VFTLGTVSSFLTNAGGTFLIQGFEGFCATSDCFSGSEARLVASGSITSVPEPSPGRTMWLGLLLLFLVPHVFKRIKD